MLDSLDRIIQDGVDRGLLQKFTSDEQLNSAEICIDNYKYVNFGSCSYLGLEYHPNLKDAVKQTVDKFGTQFSTSRTYLSIGLYEQLEKELSNMFGKPALVSASTTLGHLGALPVLVEEGDVVILDLQVHSSVQMAAQLLKANKVPIHLIPHNDMEALEKRIKTVGEKARRIWYMADGVYSMYGDYAPLQKLEALLNKHKKFHLYIDDAHGMGWTGKNGTGYVRSQIAHHPKMVLATSLNKSFAASGGVIVFPTKEMYRKVKNCGTTMIFSGPIQPPMLGAGIASAKLHQSPEFPQIQEALKAKIAFTNRRIAELGLPQYEATDSPLFFIPVGLPNIIRIIIKRMKKKGYFLNSAGFPAVPMKKGGLRFMISNNLSIQQIDLMLTALKKEYLSGLLSEGSSPAQVARQFKLPPFLEEHDVHLEKVHNALHLSESHHELLTDMDADVWNAIFATEGTNSHENLVPLQRIFSHSTAPEDKWELYVHVIRNAAGDIVLASVYSISLMMDDMLADRSVSEKLKEIRKTDRYYLTSKTLMTGTPFTKGRSLYVDFKSDDWKEALKLHVEHLQEKAEMAGATKIIIREFDHAAKVKLDATMMELGFPSTPLPANCVVRDLNWQDTDALLARLSQKYRYSLRKEILRKEDDFQIVFDRPSAKTMQDHFYSLYQTVHQRSTDIAVFELPRALFDHFYADDSYDFIQLYLKGGPQEPVAVMVSQIVNGTYYALLVGLDYTYVREYGTYKQILYQTVKRAKCLGLKKIDLAYTAEMEKKKVGAIPEENYGFIQALDHDAFAEMQLLK